MNKYFLQWLELQTYYPVFKSLTMKPHWEVVDEEYDVTRSYNWKELNEPGF